MKIISLVLLRCFISYIAWYGANYSSQVRSYLLMKVESPPRSHLGRDPHHLLPERKPGNFRDRAYGWVCESMHTTGEIGILVLTCSRDHCIDYLRQVLMCHGDIGIITFRYGRDGRSYRPNFNVTRTCRKFEPLLQWSDSHQAGNATPDGSEDD